jgi:hypothetical protein
MPTDYKANDTALAVAFPLRLERGLLRRTDPQNAVLTLVGIMARTPGGSWPGNPAFGFNEFFRKAIDRRLTAEARKKLSTETLQTINQALQSLGVSEYEVMSVEPEQPLKEKERVSREEEDKRLRVAEEPPVFVIRLRSLATERVLELAI